ncbi:aminoglycoside phosphotransferase family protein [Streptomyces sp. TRM66268-LWL]|uniref:Aminoglycoside phosphotransferase family protein n=1 Tax=Streptomyces polyasparticus TaxID=2767826 RepID=A0ABR7SC26_9ACTN|nr:aminoglycoside phosphotransferase family protein [Streptomyces polyasparticus]MBC9713031.1 aminoglycoside phosphotransferase family protein [Streptomyces polyasparticus]
MDEARARQVLDRVGFTEDAELLSLGENAVFALGDLVVKVGRSAPGLNERARHEVKIAEWLAQAGVPAVRAAESEPRGFEGHPVTVWHRLGEAVGPAEPADVAALIRLVHELPSPPAESFVLPRRELLGGVARWLRLAGDAIDPADAEFLRARRAAFSEEVSALKPHLPKGPIHGDALPRNVLVTADGPVLVDLETFSSDFREHDLVVMALSKDRYGLDPAAYDSFVRVYGWDVREWDGCAVLRGARETASCAWVAQHAPTNPRALAEFERRVASLRDGDPSVRWYPF